MRDGRPSLGLESFEQVQATPATALLRLQAQPPPELAAEPVVALVVTDGEQAHRLAALPGPPGPAGILRAAFAAPAGLLERPVRFALEFGDGTFAELPSPSQRPGEAAGRPAARAQPDLRAARAQAIADLARELLAERGARRQAERSLQARVEAEQSLRARLESVERSLEQESAARKSLSAELSARSEQLQAARQAVARAEQSAARATQLEHVIARSGEKLRQYEQERSRLHRQVQALEAESALAAAVQAQAAAASSVVQALRRRLEQAAPPPDAPEQLRRDYEQRLAELQREMEELDRGKAELERHAADLEAQLAEHRADGAPPGEPEPPEGDEGRVAELVAQRDQALAEVAGIEHRAAEFERRFAAAEQALAQAVEQLDLLAAREAAQDAHARLRDSRQAVELEAEAARSIALEAQATTAAAALDVLQRQIGQAREDLAAREGQLTELKAQRDEAIEDRRRAQARAVELERELEESDPAQAGPEPAAAEPEPAGAEPEPAGAEPEADSQPTESADDLAAPQEPPRELLQDDSPFAGWLTEAVDELESAGQAPASEEVQRLEDELNRRINRLEQELENAGQVREGEAEETERWFEEATSELAGIADDRPADQPPAASAVELTDLMSELDRLTAELDALRSRGRGS